MKSVDKEKGQIIIILLLIIVVTLAIGLSIAGRSVDEISTSTKVEESSRAFSAAEAGIEQALRQGIQLGFGDVAVTPIPEIILDNLSKAEVNTSYGIPKANSALEYPPFGKESFAQFWLANTDLSPKYNADSFSIYFGRAMDYSDNPDQAPALEVTVIILNQTLNKYLSKKYYIDSRETARITGATGCFLRDSNGVPVRTNDNTTDSFFYCQATVTNFLGGSFSENLYPIMARVRILFSDSVHPVAIGPLGGASLPSQVRIFNSKGSAGNVQRMIRIFQQKSVMPHFLDYVLFSTSELTK